MQSFENETGFQKYSQAAVLRAVEPFAVSVTPGGSIVTTFADKTISSWTPTKIYELVDFKDVVREFVKAIKGKFEPKEFKITTNSKVQELKLKGETKTINGEVFHEMVWVTNSSNGMRVLTVRYGLMRQICSNGMIAGTKDTQTFKMKHLKSNNVNEELRQFMKHLPVVSTDDQVGRIERITNKNIKIGEVADVLVNKVGTEGNDRIWKLLATKLASSKTDSLGTEYDALKKGIKVDYDKIATDILETEVPAWNVFNCYTELWRSLDASEIERETNKILEVLEGQYAQVEA